MHKWEVVSGSLERCTVPGGWIYAGSGWSVFVPEPQGEKVPANLYEADLIRRDELGGAYARGYADGKGEKVSADDITSIIRLLDDASVYVEGDEYGLTYARRCRDMARKLEERSNG